MEESVVHIGSFGQESSAVHEAHDPGAAFERRGFLSSQRPVGRSVNTHPHTYANKKTHISLQYKKVVYEQRAYTN